jgi:hypothetical protein
LASENHVERTRLDDGPVRPRSTRSRKRSLMQSSEKPERFEF